MDRFFVMPADLLFDRSLSDGDRVVYLVVLSFCDYGTGDNCFPSVQGIADRAGRKDRSSVVRSLKALVGAGWIAREKRYDGDGQVSSRYTFPRHPLVQRGAQKPHGEVRKSTTTLESSTLHPEPQRGDVSEVQKSTPPRKKRPKKPPTPPSIAYASALWKPQVDLVDRYRRGRTTRDEDAWLTGKPVERDEDDLF